MSVGTHPTKPDVVESVRVGANGLIERVANHVERVLTPELLRNERQNLLARVANGIRVRRVLEAADEEHARPRFETRRRRLRPFAVGDAMGERPVVDERADQLRLCLRDGEHAVGGGVDV